MRKHSPSGNRPPACRQRTLPLRKCRAGRLGSAKQPEWIHWSLGTIKEDSLTTQSPRRPGGFFFQHGKGKRKKGLRRLPICCFLPVASPQNATPLKKVLPENALSPSTILLTLKNNHINLISISSDRIGPMPSSGQFPSKGEEDCTPSLPPFPCHFMPRAL